MVYRITLLASIAVVFAACMLGESWLNNPLRPEVSPQWQCRRIVSMAPSITEALYALGLGDRVVGVTRDCRYPSEAADKTKIGGYFDPNFEAVVALQPDLVIMLTEQEQSLPNLKKLKIETLVVSHQTIEGLIDSFRTIGRICGKGPEGRRMAADYQNRIARIREKTESLPRPKVLMSLDRTMGLGHLADVYIVGDDDYFDKLIELSGGQNACRIKGIRYPIISSEGIMQLNPDVIIDLVYPDMFERVDRTSIVGDWNELREVDAVKNHRVVVFNQDYACVPGPRSILLVEDLARTLHPEVNWDDQFDSEDFERQ